MIACNRSTRESIASALGRPRVSSEAQCEHSGDRILVWAADDKAPWPQSTGYHTRADVERSLDRRVEGKSVVRHFAPLMSEMGLVSRVSPVQTALRNCTRDEGRSFEVGNQVLISSHRKLLLSKAMVVNVAEKSGQDSDRQG